MKGIVRKFSWLKVAAIGVVLTYASGAYAAYSGFSSNLLVTAGYEVYSGDINGDGIGDVLLKARPDYLLIHAEISFPIPLPERKGFILLSSNDGSFRIVNTLDNDLLDHTAWVSGGFELMFADVNGNRRAEMLVRATSSGQTSFLIASGSADGVPFIYQQLTVDLGAEQSVTFQDVDADGLADIVLDTNGDRRAMYGSQAGGLSLPVSLTLDDWVGSTAGTFQVSPSGAGQYTIPIVVSPGVGGMQPGLTIQYNSAGGDGPLGLRFSLGGLSRITRCPQTFAQDGKFVPVKLSSDDRFCLDGMRLIANEYGGSSATYRLELDDFSEITHIGDEAGNPKQFVVKTKSGLTKFYGKVRIYPGHDSSSVQQKALDHPQRLTHDTTGAHFVWMLAHVEDSTGNYIRYWYENVDNELYLSEIDYTGNSNIPSNGLQPFAKVKLIYKQRELAPLLGYFRGMKVQQSRLLVGVKSFLGAELVRSYSLDYKPATQARELIWRITECGGPAGKNCLPPTHFDWEYQAGGVSRPWSAHQGPHSGGGSWSSFAVDADADGMQDIYQISHDFSGDGSSGKASSVLVHLSNRGDFELVNRQVLGDFSEGYQKAVGDFNGDGKTDVVFADYYISHYSPASNSSSGGLDAISSMPLPSGGDLNSTASSAKAAGSVAIRVNLVSVWLMGANGEFVHGAKKSFTCDSDESTPYECDAKPQPVGEVGSLHVADFNGDGLDDVLVAGEFESGSKRVQLYISKGDGRFEIKDVQYLNDYQRLRESEYIEDGDDTRPSLGRNETDLHVVDVTGDHLPDVIFAADPGAQTSFSAIVWENDGSGRFVERHRTFGSQSLGENAELFFFDVNRDGAADLVLAARAPEVAKVIVRLSDQTGRFGAEIQSAAPVTNSLDDFESFVGDFNGDGVLDVGWGRTNTEKPIYFEVMRGDSRGGFSPPVVNQARPQSSLTWFSQFVPGDFNGDGKTDVVPAYADTYQYFINEIRGDYPTPSAEKSYWCGDCDTSIKAKSISNSDDWSNGGLHTYVVGRITSGVGAEVRIDHQRLTHLDSYDPTDGCGGYPQAVVCGPLHVVSAHSVSNPTVENPDGVRTLSYHYENLRADALGRGLQGFEQMSVTDHVTGLTEVTEYAQAFPHMGAAVLSKTCIGEDCSGSVLSETRNTLESKQLVDEGGSSWFPFASESIAVRYDLLGKPVNTIKTEFFYEEPVAAGSFFGNLTRSVISQSASDGRISGYTHTTSTVHEYDAPGFSQRLGRLSRTVVTRTAPDSSAQSRTSAFEYHPVTGLLSAEIIEPDLPQFRLRTSYLRDGLGNIIQTTVTGTRSQQLVTTSSQTPDMAVVSQQATSQFELASPYFGRFETRTCNALDHCSTQQFEPLLGEVTRQTDPNGVIQFSAYDPFGRLIGSERTAGSVSVASAYTRGWCADDPEMCADPLGIFFLRKNSQDGSQSVEVFDRQERVVRAASRNGAGNWIQTLTRYNDRGLPYTTSTPHLAGQSAYWSVSHFDSLGRVFLAVSPCGEDGAERCETRFEFDGNYTKQTDARENVSEIWVNALGQVTRLRDHAGTTIDHRYDAFENLTSTTKRASGLPESLVVMAYDIRGRKYAMSDPDLGDWSYLHNAFGELEWQRDAKGQVIQLRYDRIGRVLQRHAPDGNTEWEFDTKRKGEVSRALYTQAGSPVHERRFEYFDSGLLREEAVSILGEPDKLTRFTYDHYGRKLTTTNPGGFSTQNSYNHYGALFRVSNTQTNATYWQAESWDKWGKSLATRYGNGVDLLHIRDAARGMISAVYAGKGSTSTVQNLTYKWDEVGNLSDREDRNQGSLREHFNYDSLNRLKSATLHGVTGSPVTVMSLEYDAYGNIRSKTGVGVYQYEGDSPHAASRVGGSAYEYDDNGNLRSGSGRTYEYASFNLPTRIEEGGQTVNFWYGLGAQKIRQTTAEKTITYVTPLYEEHLDGTTTTQKHHIATPDGVVAIVSYSSGSSAGAIEYLHMDHLGSITAITDSAGMVRQRLSFDAFGKPRAGNWQGELSNAFQFLTAKGYTGHEMLHDVGLIHMNGRVYDPQIGRFISADPFIQFPQNIQSYNRYSYVLNGPLSATDPSGFLLSGLYGVMEKFMNWVGDNAYVIAAVMMTVATSGVAAAYAWQIGLAISAAGGYGIGVMMSGGNQQAGLIGALTAGAFFGIGAGLGKLATGASATARNWLFAAKVVSHGLVGGFSSVASGGRFKEGFLSASFTAAASPWVGYIDKGNQGFSGGAQRVVAAAVVGGTASELGGGKFANGAVTGAFSRAFNTELHPDYEDKGRAYISRELGKIEAIATNFIDDLLSRPDVSAEAEICGGGCLGVEYDGTPRGGDAISLRTGFGVGVLVGIGSDIRLLSTGGTPLSGTITTLNFTSLQLGPVGFTVSSYSWLPAGSTSAQSYTNLEYNWRFPGGARVNAGTGVKAW